MAVETCKCGSGLPFARCHGDPRNDFARAQALREAEGIAFFFPAVRLRGAAVEHFADETAAAYPEAEGLPVEEGLRLVSTDELRRLVDSWAEPYADRWLSLRTAAGDDSEAERALAVGALRAAVAERQPTPRELIEQLEGGSLRRSPLAALALAIAPQFVWSIDEGRAARIAAGGRRKARQRSETVEQLAYALITWGHVLRVRRLAAGLRQELAGLGLPTAARTLDEACTRVAQTDEDARAAAAALLIAYAERDDLHHLD